MKHLNETMVNESARNTWISVKDAEFMCINTKLNMVTFYNYRDIREVCESLYMQGVEKKIYDMEMGETYPLNDDLTIIRIHY